MPRQKITSSELEERLDGSRDPISEFPPGFPTMHSKIPPTPSKFVVDAVAAVLERGVTEDRPDEKERALREEFRTKFRRISGRR